MNLSCSIEYISLTPKSRIIGATENILIVYCRRNTLNRTAEIDFQTLFNRSVSVRRARNTGNYRVLYMRLLDLEVSTFLEENSLTVQ